MIPRIILISIMLFICMASTLSAQVEGRGPYDPKLAEAVLGLGKRYALLIGVEYAPPFTLDWTAKDAEMVGNEFKTKLSGLFDFHGEYSINWIPDNKSSISCRVVEFKVRLDKHIRMRFDGGCKLKGVTTF